MGSLDAPDFTLIVAGDPDQFTGGYVYDARMVTALRQQGWRVDVVGLDGRFPAPDARARESMATALAALPDGARVLIDGLAMGGLPAQVEPHSDRLRILALVHHPLAAETGLDASRRQAFMESETRALAAARRVIVTSAHTARGLSRFGVAEERIRVVEPGVEAASLAASALDPEDGARPQRLLCVATLTPRKGQDLLIEALAGLTDRDWECEAVGSHERDPDYAARLVAETNRRGLSERLHWSGEKDARGLADAYHRADLFVLPSHYEGYGMVVTEALARGLPVITTSGGALADTLPPAAGMTLPPGDAPALRDALARWFDDPDWRRRLRLGARQARVELGDWQQAGKRFADALALDTPQRPSNVFSIDWLERREFLDGRSRSHQLTGLAAEWLGQRPGTHRILDLGSGSGSNLRFLAPRLPGPQHWRLLDHDNDLLAHARRRSGLLRDLSGDRLSVDTSCRDLASVDEAFLAGSDLVVASALFDLVSRSWVETLVQACARRHQAMLITLSVDGDWAFLDPQGQRLEDGEDIAVRTLFQAHQVRDKGLGQALGGEAPAVLTTCLTQAGFRVDGAATPWHLIAGEPEGFSLAEALITGWHDAALEQAPTESGRLAEWRERRLSGLKSGELGVMVGHRDILARPVARHRLTPSHLAQDRVRSRSKRVSSPQRKVRVRGR